MPLTDVIATFSTAAADGSPGGYPVTRRAAASFGSTGLVVSGGTSSLTVDACVQPLTGRTDVVLPEGVHVNDVRVIDTAVPMQANPSDLITIAGEPFAVFRVDGPVNFNGGTRYTSYASRQVYP